MGSIKDSRAEMRIGSYEKSLQSQLDDVLIAAKNASTDCIIKAVGTVLTDYDILNRIAHINDATKIFYYAKAAVVISIPIYEHLPQELKQDIDFDKYKRDCEVSKQDIVSHIVDFAPNSVYFDSDVDKDMIKSASFIPKSNSIIGVVIMDPKEPEPKENVEPVTPEALIEHKRNSLEQKVKDYHRFKLLSIMSLVTALNFLLFGSLFLMRSVVSFYSDFAILDFILLVFVLAIVITLLVVTTFERRMTDAKHKRVLEGLRLDYFLKWIAVTLWMTVEIATKGNIAMIQVFLISCFVIHLIYDIAMYIHYHYKYKGNLDEIIIRRDLYHADRHLDIEKYERYISNDKNNKIFCKETPSSECLRLFGFCIIGCIFVPVFLIIVRNFDTTTGVFTSIIFFVMMIIIYIVCWVMFMHKCKLFSTVRITALIIHVLSLTVGDILVRGTPLWGLILPMFLISIAPLVSCFSKPEWSETVFKFESK